MRINKPEFLIIHHFGGIDSDPLYDTSNQTVEIVNEWHRRLWDFKSTLGWYCGYHYVIEKSGKITQCRADNEEGAHTKGMNLKSIGVALAGNFDATLPTAEQTEALAELLKELSIKYSIPATKIVPHRKFANTNCYGNKLSDDWAANLLKTDTRTRLSEYTIEEMFAELQIRIIQMKGKGK